MSDYFKREHIMSSSWILEDDVSLDIFSRLPVKDVMRCKCVCRSWRVLLSTRHFVNMHLMSLCSNNLYRGDVVFVDVRVRDVPKYDIDLVENFWGEGERLRPLLFPLNMKRVVLVGSCNGLLCFTNHLNPYQVYVWNPCTGESTQFPLNPSQFKDMYYSGFGYDATRDEYKVLTMSDVGVNEVWTLGSNSWRNAGVVPFMPLVSSSVFVDGALHCLSHQSKVIGVGSFHVATEEFQFVRIPRKLSNQFSVMGTLRGTSIAMACVEDVPSCDRFDIWAAEDYKIEESWTRRYVLGVNFIRHIEILKDWELLIDHQDKGAAVPGSTDENLLLEGVVSIASAYVHIGTLVSPIREQCYSATKTIWRCCSPHRTRPLTALMVFMGVNVLCFSTITCL